ncbi:MAG: protein kinase [Candidatus Muiribacteriota bacterium]
MKKRNIFFINSLYIILCIFFIFCDIAYSQTPTAMLSRGIEAYQRGRDDEAAELFKKIIDVAPRTGEAYYYLGLIWSKKREFSRAELNFRKALEIDPRWSAAHEKLGIAFVEQNKIDEAKTTFANALRFNPNSGESLKFFANQAFLERDYEKAKEYYNRLRENAGLTPELSKNIGWIYLEEGDYINALNHFVMYSGLFPFDKNIANRVFLLRQLNNNNLHPELRKRALSMIPMNVDLSAKDLREEFQEFLRQEEIKNRPKEEKVEIVHVELPQESGIDKLIIYFSIIFAFAGAAAVGFIYLKKISINKTQDTGKVNDKITKKTIDETENEEDLLKLLNKAKSQGDEQNQIILMKKIGKNNPGLLYEAAIKLEESGKNDESIEILSNLKNNTSGDLYFEILMDLLRLYVKKNNIEKAIDTFKLVKKIGSINMNTFLKKIDSLQKNLFHDLKLFLIIIDFLVANNNVPKALSYLERFLEVTENEAEKAEVAKKLVKILQEQNLNREAINVFKKLIENYPENVEYYFGIINSLLSIEDFSKVTVYVSTVLKGFSDQKYSLGENILNYSKKSEKLNDEFHKVIEALEEYPELNDYIKQIYEEFTKKNIKEETLFKFYKFLNLNYEIEGFDLIDVFIQKKWLKFFNKFMDDLNNYLRRESNDLKRISQMADILYISGRYPECFVLFKKMHELEPGDKDILLKLFQISTILDREDEISEYGNLLPDDIPIMEKALTYLKVDNNSPKKIHLLECKLLLKINKPEKAFEKLRYLEIKNPDDIELKEYFALLLQNYHPKEALEKYKYLLKNYPDNVDYWKNAARMLEKINNREQAFKAYVKLLKLNADNEIIEESFNFMNNWGYFDFAIDNIGIVKENREVIERNILKEKSRFEFKILSNMLKGAEIPHGALNHILNGKNIEIEPTKFITEKAPKLDKTGLKIEMCEKYYFMELYDEGIELAQELLKQNEYWKTRYYLGMCFFEKGMYEIAFRELSNISWNTSSFSIDEILEENYKLAKLFEERHMEKEALHFYREIFAKDVNFKDIRKKIEEIDTRVLLSKTIDETTGLSLDIRRRYDDIKELGKGGMGVVYKAKDKKLGRTVALKVMLSEFVNNKEAVNRFLKEARAIAALNHPNIISIFDINSDKNVFISMEYFEGENLKEIMIKDKIISVDKLLKFGEKICDGLQFAHDKGIVHRDIKPENIMVDKKGNLKIMDFGLARIESEEGAKTGEILGTPYYMSPEQIKGDEVDNRTDIYSLGVTLYQLSTGKLPFSEGDVKEKHVNEIPAIPSSINKKIQPEFDQIIMKCMAKRPEQRYSGMREIKADLKKLKVQI